MPLLQRASLVAGVFLALHLLLAFWSPLSLWGIDFLAFYETFYLPVFVVLALVLLIPRSRELILRGASGVAARHDSLQLPVKALWAGLLTGLGVLALFVVLHSRTHLLGDGYLYIRELDEGLWQQTPRTDRAPLTFFLIRRLHAFGGSLWGDAETTYRIYSYVSGLLFVGLLARICGELGRNRTEAWVLGGLVGTAGFVQVFFGYVENYAFHFTLLALYLHLGFRSLRLGTAPWSAALVLGVLLPSHFAYLSLLPSLFLLVFLGSTDPRAFRSEATWTRAIGLTLLPLATATLILLAIGFNPITYLAADKNHFLPLLADPGFTQHYRLFSFNHFLDMANLAVLVAAPAILALLVVGRFSRARDRFILFPLVASLGALLFVFLVNPEIGVFRDWDILAFWALPFTLAAGLLLVRSVPEPARLATVGLLISGAALLHAATWVGLNSCPDKASARFQNVLETAPLSQHALSYGWEGLGAYYFGEGRPDEATAAYDKAAGAASGNARHWISLGAIQLETGDPDGAMVNFQKALRLAPDRTDVHNKIGLAFMQKNEPQKALESFAYAIELDPADADAYFNRGALYLQSRQYEKAYREFEEATRINPQLAEGFANQASALYATGQFEEAIRKAEQALELREDLPDALYTVGASYWQMNERDRARRSFQRFLEVDPRNPNADAVRRILGSP